MFLIKGREALKKAATEHLYEESKGCTDEFTTLRAVLQFFMLKSQYGWSDASFNKFWRVRTKLFPKGNKVSTNTYYATTGVEKIDACRNHCILYRCDDYKDLESCPNCGVSRYKTNKHYREEENGAYVETGKKRKKTKKPVIWLALNLLKTLVLLRLVDPQWFYSRLGMVKIQKLG
jgi:hypothetical protein